MACMCLLTEDAQSDAVVSVPETDAKTIDAVNARANFE
jgi:hypothetical protein